MKKTLALFLLLFSTLCAAATPLPGQQAFKMSAKVIDPNTLLVNWDIAPGYFLYKERLAFKLQTAKVASLGKLILPVGRKKVDRGIGTFQVYRNELRVPISLLGLKAGTTELKIHYQGCADSGFCYPPTDKMVQLHIDKQLGLASANLLTRTATQATPPAPTETSNPLFASHNLFLILLSFFGLGLLLSLTPCVLPMIPIISSIVVGHGDKITTGKAFRLSLVYVLSMSVTYVIVAPSKFRSM